MTGKGALDNIAIKFDEYGYEPTNLGIEPNQHFSEIFRYEMEIINKDLDRLEKLENVLLKFARYELAMYVDTDGKYHICDYETYVKTTQSKMKLTEQEFNELVEML